MSSHLYCWVLAWQLWCAILPIASLPLWYNLRITALSWPLYIVVPVLVKIKSRSVIEVIGGNGNKMAVCIRKYRKSYADGSQMHHVLNQLNLSVEPNTRICRDFGPSGSGKIHSLVCSYRRRGGFLSLRPRLDSSTKGGQWTTPVHLSDISYSYMKIGDQLELVTQINEEGEKGQKKNMKSQKRIWASTYSCTQSNLVGKNNGRPSLVIGSTQVILADEPTASPRPRSRKKSCRKKSKAQERHHGEPLVRSILTYVDTIYELNFWPIAKGRKSWLNEAGTKS